MKNNGLQLLAFLLVIEFFSLGAANASDSDGTLFVAPNGIDDQSQEGTKERPLKSLSYALKKASPGTTIYLRAGRYREEVTLGDVHGTAEKPIVISAYSDEKVWLDGTDELDLVWRAFRDGIVRADVTKDVWQLFVDGEQMMPARWPNARFDNGTVYSQDGWANALVEPSSNGHLFDDPSKHDLAASGLNLTGALVIANTGSFTTWTRKVTRHTPGQADFFHDKTPSIKNKHFKYFVEGKLDFLDQSTEWFYDKKRKQIFLKPKVDVANASIRGKVRSYSFDVEGWRHVQINNINFYAAPIQCEKCEHIILENVNFDFAGVSRRMLGEAGTKAEMLRLSTGRKGSGHFTLRNCRISDTDSQALVVQGDNSIIENCHFENTDYAVTEVWGPGSDIALSGRNVIYRFNTNINSGNSATIASSGVDKLPNRRPYPSLIAEFNDVSKTGFAQTDGSVIQGHIPMQNGVRIRYNWFHDTPKFGMRFDAPIPAVRWGKFGLVHHNVIWNTGGMMIKGTDHRVLQNLVFNSEGSDLIVLVDKPTEKQLKKKNVKPGTKIGGGNLRTRTQNNIADSISGHRKKPMPVPGESGSNIDMALAGGQVKDLLVDAANRDFRLKAAVEQDADYLADEDVFWLYRDRQPHFGVYPFDAQFYWIPGKRLSLPSHPIPADEASLRRGEVDLMWREAYKATSHRVFLTTKKIELESEQPHESLIIGHFENTNIARINLVQGETYFWRVDALVDETWQRGDIWSLKRELQK